MNISSIASMYKDGTKVFTKKFYKFFSRAIIITFRRCIYINFDCCFNSEIARTPGAAIALVFFFFYLPSLVCAPIAGMLVDKISRKKMMILSTFYRLGILLLFLYATLKLHFPISNLFVYISFLLLGVGTAFFYPAKMAALPNIVP